MQIEEALWQVRTIQLQVAHTEQYCCYRWATVAGSGATALVAATLQPRWVGEPLTQPGQYLAWWIAVAAISVMVIGAEILLRWLRSDSDYRRRQTISALRQFAPSVVAGALLTGAIQLSSPVHAPLYPALWSAVFSLGVFASLRHLPAGSSWLAAYYLLAALVCIAWGHGDQALQPWTMAMSFGVGQLLAAMLLFGQSEAVDDPS